MGREITQSQLEKKYGTYKTDVSRALKAGNVKPIRTTKGKWPQKIYKESDAVTALIRMYVARFDAHKNKAIKWKKKIEKTQDTYLGRKIYGTEIDDAG
jgi:hypothetical protein